VKTRRRAFILLEVLVAVVIVGIAMVALVRGFIVALDSFKKIRRNEIAIALAKSLLDDMILEPPEKGRLRGRFSEDPRFGEAFDGWLWELDVESDEPNYEEKPRGALAQDLEEVYTARLTISYTEARNDEKVYLDVYTNLAMPDLFSADAIQKNQLF